MNTIKKPVMLFVILLALAYLAACAYLYFAQHTFIYYPTSATSTGTAETLLVESENETIRVLRAGPEDADAVVYFGGNAEDVGQEIAQFVRVFPDKAVYLVNYRGYGGSTGKPTEAGLFKDAMAVFDAVKKKHRRISVIGRSLGSGIAVYLATVRPVNKLILVTPYDSIENIAKKQFPMFPVPLLLRDKYASLTRASAIKVPTLVVLAENDNVIPRKNSEALIKALPASLVAVAVVPGTTHNTIGTDRYWQHLHNFLADRHNDF